MKRRKKDFIEVSSFLFVTLSILLFVFQPIVNIVYFVFSAQFISFWTNFKLFLSFELFFVILSISLGLIYITWYFKYKIDSDGRERKIKRRKKIDMSNDRRR